MTNQAKALLAAGDEARIRRALAALLKTATIKQLRLVYVFVDALCQ